MLRLIQQWMIPLRKGLIFGAVGAAGCLILAAVLGEPLWALTRPPPPKPVEPPLPPPPPQLDVMFVLDVTDSMQREIDIVRDNIASFVQSMSGRELDTRIGLLAFRDHCTEKEEPEILRFEDGQPFTKDFQAFQDAAGRLKAQGGGDEPESSLDALALAAEQPFRPTATKVLVLITDAEPHVPDKFMHSVAETAQVLKDKKIDQLHVVVDERDHKNFYKELQDKGAPGRFFRLLARERQKFEEMLPKVGTEISQMTVEKQPTIMSLQTHEEFSEESSNRLLFATCLWTALLALGISLALIGAQNWYLHRPLLPRREGTQGALGSLIAGGAAGLAGQLLFQHLAAADSMRELVSRIVGWAILGGLIGVGMGFFVPNLKVFRALIAGNLGGALGALAFVQASLEFGDLPGRLLGAAILGFCIGLMVPLVEAVFREVWLEVHFRARECRLVGLGARPVCIGSDPQCTVYVKQAPPVALRYVHRAGQIRCENLTTGRQATIFPGDEKLVGPVRVVVRALASRKPALNVAAAGTGFSLVLANGKVLSLTLGAQFQTGDLPGIEPDSASGMVAEVVSNPKNPTILGLKNLSRRTWWGSLPDGSTRQIDPGRSIQLLTGGSINFGSIQGEIH